MSESKFFYQGLSSPANAKICIKINLNEKTKLYTDFEKKNLAVPIRYIKFSNKYYYKDMEPLCNQVLHNQFETFHRCYKHIEGVRVIFSRQENLF